ncbi:MAG: murein L,D-transpeptidase [Chloroflexota bacterium]|nr:MAG: murein L,D-transpeptidase [Chloroflexota bacterium]
MKKSLSRRDFLKISALSLSALASNAFPPPQDEDDYPPGEVGRVAYKSISVFRKPELDSETVGYRFLDDLVNIYNEVAPATGPEWNPRWYRIWGGYIHSAHVQRVRVRFNQPARSLPTSGHQLCEVTVPFTQIYYYTKEYGWQRQNKLYYETTHWAVGIDEGPDGEAWYRLYDELLEMEYHVPASHMRLISDEEIAPLSPDVPPEQKRIEVVLQDQTLTAYEKDQIVFETKVSTGIPSGRIPPEGTQTPQGRFNISPKLPTKHMGDGLLTGAPDVYTLPGVPWTMFFHPTGVAFHGAYWHDNFGVPMSHGCVNMRISDAKWLFRWTTPIFPPPPEDRKFWERNGYGTAVHVI